MKSSSYNLIMSAMFNGRKGERPPVGNPTSIVCHGLMDAAGVSFPDAHLDANAMADLALAGHEILGFDTVMPEYSVQQEGAALGCVVDWGNRDRMPDNKNFPYEDFSDVVVPDHLLEKPSMKVVLEALSILRRQVGGKVAIVGKVMGPWTLSYPPNRYGRNRKSDKNAKTADAGNHCLCAGSIQGGCRYRRYGRSCHRKPGGPLSL